jgi:hypothetical protein
MGKTPMIDNPPEMVERVARALFYYDCASGPSGLLATSTDLSRWDDNRQKYLKLARAAISAMRKPTEAMAKAGDSVIDHETGTAYFDGYDCWIRMIDEALK